MAVKAPPYPILVRQPDGSTITLYIKGDEFFHYAVADNGKAMVMDKDGFYRTAELPSAALAAAIREQNIMRFNAAGGFRPINRAAVSSSVKALIIPVEFKDRSFSVSAPKEHFHNMLNSPGYSENGGTGSAKDYFEANMPGYTFTFDVTAPVRLSREYSYYGENDISVPNVINYDMRLNELVQEACSLASASVSFPVYDRDGDGQADYIFFYLAGYNEAESGDDGTVWPQTYNISSEGIRVNGIRIGLFGCSSELSGSDLGIEGL